MGKVILITGGSRSGKSKFAEDFLKNEDDVLYIATAIITDEEMEERIKIHKERRNSLWTTYEGYKHLSDALDGYDNKNILLDCVTVMITNLMFDKKHNYDDMSKAEIQIIQDMIEKEFNDFILMVRNKDINLILVTNELGYGLVPEYKLGRIFRDIAGIINQLLASLSDDVYFVSCGLPLKLK